MPRPAPALLLGWRPCGVPSCIGGKRWQHVEVDQLEALIEELQPRDGERGDWDALAARLTPVEATKFEVRTGKSALCN